MISIHALLAESDASSRPDGYGRGNFYPRSPCGERPFSSRWVRPGYFISIHALLAESDLSDIISTHPNPISIHALLAESDRVGKMMEKISPISIHALLAESDKDNAKGEEKGGEFLSTLSLRRATRHRPPDHPGCNISIHALLAESDDSAQLLGQLPVISIHALLAESDARIVSRACWRFGFLSTLSLRRATLRGAAVCPGLHFYPRSPCGERPKARRRFSSQRHFYPRSPCGERQRSGQGRPRGISISIHALLAESDAAPGAITAHPAHFYPRSPCGERQYAVHVLSNKVLFLSTLSLRRATQADRVQHHRRNISIHALLAESDVQRPKLTLLQLGISIHALLAESDPWGRWNTRARSIFLSTLSLRRATIDPMPYSHEMEFLSTLSLRRATP